MRAVGLSRSRAPSPFRRDRSTAPGERQFQVSLSTISPPLLELDHSLALSGAPIGGRSVLLEPNWRKITSDEWVLRAITGYSLEFSHLPPPQLITPRPLTFSSEETALIASEVQSLFAKKAIEPVPNHLKANSFVSQLFLRPKKDGGWRPVFNLRKLNTYITYEHFKMEGLYMLKGLLSQGDFVAKIDLKDAYFTIPIAPPDRRYLCFEWNGVLWQFTCLCFGLASAPRVFTKVLKPILAILRHQGLKVIIFLDDILIISSSEEQLQLDVACCVQLLCDLGFVINVSKSALNPVHRLSFLGLVLDTLLMQLFVPDNKISDITALGNLLLSVNQVQLWDLAKFVGKVNATRLALLPSPLFVRHVQQLLIQGLHTHRSYDAYVLLSEDARTELRLWLAEVWTWNGRNIIPPDPVFTVTSDASKSGWAPSVPMVDLSMEPGLLSKLARALIT